MTQRSADDSTEPAVTGSLRFAAKPPLDWVRDLAVRHGGRAARLYYASPRLNVAVTVVSGVASSRTTSALWEDEPPPDLLGTLPLPPDNAAAFLDQLLQLGAWTLPQCRLNTRDGFSCYHAVADAAVENCIAMGNADLHPDPRYVQILNLYSAWFLRDLVSMKHAPCPEIVTGVQRAG